MERSRQLKPSGHRFETLESRRVLSSVAFEFTGANRATLFSEVQIIGVDDPETAGILFQSPSSLLLSRQHRTEQSYTEPAEIYSGNQSFAFTVIDREGDGDSDVLIATRNRVFWLMNDSGSFLETDAIAEFSDGQVPPVVNAVDFDRDGDLDVMLGKAEVLSVLVNQGDSHTEMMVASHVPGSVIRDIRAFDIDRDGDSDLAVSVEDEAAVLWLENEGTTYSETFQLVSDSFSRNVAVFGLADLNNDSFPDVITAEASGLVWHENLGDGTISPVGHSISGSAADVTDLTFFDYDNDGDLDILSSADGETDLSQGLFLHENLGNGNAWQTGDIETLYGTSVDQMSEFSGDSERVFAAIVGGDVSAMLLDTDTRKASEQMTFNGRLQDVDLMIADDMDGNSRVNVVVSSTNRGHIYWFEHNAGGYRSHAISRGNDNLRALATGDVDGDGSTDVVIAMADGAPGEPATLAWLQNDGTSRYFARDLIIETEFLDADLDLADADADGDLDLFIRQYNGDQTIVLWYEFRSDLLQFQPVSLLISVPTDSVATDLIDFDEDGDLDVLVAHFDEQDPTTQFKLFENLDGQGIFVQSRTSSANIGDVKSIEIVDQDGDGISDAVVTSGQGVSVLRDYSRLFDSPEWQTLIEANDQVMARLGDLDADGDLDVVLATQDMRRIEWYEWSVDSQLSAAREIYSTRDEILTLELADTDSDGRTDIIVGHNRDTLFSLDNRVIGDVNRDGAFDSADLVAVFQVGEYEDLIPRNSTFSEGDWNQDGEFDSSDLVLAFQAGHYDAEAAVNAYRHLATFRMHPSNETAVGPRVFIA